MSKHKIIGGLGLTGSGKTCDQTEQYVLPAILAGRRVAVNWWINLDYPNIKYYNDWEEIKDLKNYFIGIDEVTDIADPRSWADEAGEFRRWWRLHRKHHLDIVFNTQDISLVAKTIGILAHTWEYYRTAENPFEKLFKRVSMEYCAMTYQELKKMAAGWDLTGIIEAQGEFQTINYPIRRLLHHELDDHKIELIHRYCPDCDGRQGKQIKRGEEKEVCHLEGKKGKETWALNEREVCPDHGTDLQIRESGIYDTDQEIEIKEVKGVWRYYVPSPEGMIMVEYKGTLSENQTKERDKLNLSLKTRRPLTHSY